MTETMTERMTLGTLPSMTNVDGRITPTHKACVPVLDRGFLYGDSVYEVFRTYSGVPLFYAEHWQRMVNSARLCHMHISQSEAELREEIRRTVIATGACERKKDIYVRYHVTRGEGPVDLYPNPELRTRYVIIVKEVPTWNPEHYRVGMKAAIPNVRRNPVNALDPNIKGGNYLNNVLAVTEARELGADESIMLNRENLVTEASNSNVSFVIDGELVSPGAGAGILAGLTKRAIYAACESKGLAAHDRDIHVNDLPRATECFVTSATREVMPIVSLRLEDGSVIEFPPGGGEITRKVARYYREYLEAYVKDHAELRMW